MTVALRHDHHPLADLFPLMPSDELAALAVDIEAHGLHNPIVIFDGMVLDGRNRLAACELVGVEPHFETFDGTEDEALAFVLSLNLSRRHLSTAQRAVLALKLLPLEVKRARVRMKAGVADPPQNSAEGAPGGGEAAAIAGARVGVSRETVRQAARLAEHASEVLDAIASGVVRSMPEALRLGQVPTALRRSVVERLRRDGGKVNQALRAVRSEELTGRIERPPVPVSVEEPGVRLIYGCHVFDALRGLPDESVQTVVTSPPYWNGLRDYGAPPVVWGGDDSECEHVWEDEGAPHHAGQVEQTKASKAIAAGAGQNAGSGSFCLSCGAWRGHIGHEPTVDLYARHLVDVFEELRRVLRQDGTVWLVLGDCYIGPQPGYGDLKPKDLVMMPHRVAIALQAAGWWIRADIVWAKPNALPESVTSRPTRSHEYVFLLAKSGDYYYDADAVREPFTDLLPKQDKRSRQRGVGGRVDGHTLPHGIDPRPGDGRNRRSVWTLPTQPLDEAHWASFPEALVEPMVLAGTSAAGACATCGTPWVRSAEHAASSAANDHLPRSGEDSEAARVGSDWQPSCGCTSGEVVPCTVLDPFSGSGTTGKVARDHGRAFIGIDLSAAYLAMAKRRILGDGG